MIVENRSVTIPDSDLYRSNILEKVYNNFPTYNEFAHKRITKMAHCGCSQYCDYIFSTDGLNGLYLYSTRGVIPIIELGKEPLNLLNIYDFIVTKSGYGYFNGEDLLIAGFKLDDDRRYMLVMASISIVANGGYDTPYVIINDKFELPLYGMDEGSEEPEYVIGMQSVYGNTYIATNYRLILISRETVNRLQEFVYPNDMIRPNGMVVSNTTDVILYYKNDIIPIYYKFDIVNSDNPWYSFVDQKEYKIIDAIIFNNSLLVYGDDSKIHVINDIHGKNPSIDDFIEYAGHSWVGRAVYDAGNIFIKSISIDMYGQSRIDYMYSVNGINFDKFYSESLPVNSESSMDASIYMGHGSIIIYDSNHPRFNIIKLGVDVCSFERVVEHKDIPITSISKSTSDQTTWRVYTDIDVPLNLKSIDICITYDIDTEVISNSDFICYQNYEVVYNSDTKRHTLLFILKSARDLSIDDLHIDVSISLYI